MVRKWAGFSVRPDPERVLISGLLFDEMTEPAQDCAHITFHPGIGQGAFLFPQGGARVRAYLISPHGTPHRLQGENDVPRFVEESAKTNFAPALYRGARPAGPLATFSTADTWVEHPCGDGVVLVGDAAASSDPPSGKDSRSRCGTCACCATACSRMTTGRRRRMTTPRHTTVTTAEPTR